MHILRRVVLAIFASLFLLLLFATATDFGVTRTLGRPSSVKHIIAVSGVYNSIIPSLLDQAKAQTSDQGSISLTNPIIKQAAAQTITPAYLQTTTETTIDSIYDWLNGKTPQPNFRIDLTAAKLAFANNVASQVAQKASTMKVCSAALSGTSFDPLTATCLPPGVSAQAAGQKVKDNLTNGKGFLDNPVITANSIKAANPSCGNLAVQECGPGQPPVSVFSGQLKGVPKQYQLAKKSPYILTIATLILAGLVVLLSSPRRKGLKRVGLTLLIVGLFMLVFAWTLNREVGNQLVPRIKNGNPVIQQDIRNVAIDLAQEVKNNYWLIGAAYAVVGAATFAAATYIGRGKKQSTAATPTEKPPTDKSTTTPAVPAPPKHSPPKKKIIKIQ